jgi:cell division protein ZapD
MLEPAPDFPDPESVRDQVVYEQPLNERMRTFLRLEFLFRQARHHLNGRSAWETRASLASFIDVLAILNRGDVRNEVLKEIERHTTNLQRYEAQPGVDRTRLGAVLSSLAKLRENLNNAGKHFTQDLRDCEFLSAIRHRSAIPGGTCQFDLPDFNHWLSRPYKRRRADMDGWLASLEPLENAVNELLWLTRESSPLRHEVAVDGMYQHNLERNACCQLLRIALPAQSNLYPETSASPQRFTIRFRTWRTIDTRPELVTQDVSFLLSCC